MRNLHADILSEAIQKAASVTVDEASKSKSSENLGQAVQN